MVNPAMPNVLTYSCGDEYNQYTYTLEHTHTCVHTRPCYMTTKLYDTSLA